MGGFCCLHEVPDGYRATNDRESIKVMVQREPGVGANDRRLLRIRVDPARK